MHSVSLVSSPDIVCLPYREQLITHCVDPRCVALGLMYIVQCMTGYTQFSEQMVLVKSVLMEREMKLGYAYDLTLLST